MDLSPYFRMILDCVRREYPVQVSHVMHSDLDARPARELTPAFCGAYDWHSAVHGHWALVRLIRLLPDAAPSQEARQVLADSFTERKLAQEVQYLQTAGREGFERPYGLAWLLQLAAELREWPIDEAARWLRCLAPLERLAVERLSTWLPKLPYPIRSGEHSQTAFAMGLALDYAHTAGDSDFAALLTRRAVDFHQDDRDGPLHLEPSGHDFLSPCLGTADLMRRLLEPLAFSSWLTHFLPQLSQNDVREHLHPVETTDPADGKLAHLDGLNLSRAWMLEGIADGLPDGDPRWPVLMALAADHAHAGFASLTGIHYAGGHWLGSFAVYTATGAGRPRTGAGIVDASSPRG